MNYGQRWMVPPDGVASSCMPVAGKIERLWIDAQKWALRRMERLSARRRRGPATATAAHLEVGLRGERAAMFELQRRGHIVVARRWTSTRMRGAVDMVAWDDGPVRFLALTKTPQRMGVC